MLSTCAKCGGHLFELAEQAPSGSRLKVQFVQCSSCGNPIGAMDYFDTASLIDELKNEIASLKSDVSYVNIALQNIERKIR